MVDLFQLQLASSTIYVSGRRAAERMGVYVTQLAQFPPGAIASYHTSPTTFPAPDSTPVTVPYLPLCLLDPVAFRPQPPPRRQSPVRSLWKPVFILLILFFGFHT